jgi:hypothetical protein
MPRDNTQPGFFLFWAAACAAWTVTWLLVDFVLVPEPLRVSPLRLVTIGLATGLAPVVVLCAGRVLLSVVARGLSFAWGLASSLRTAAFRTNADRAGEPSARRTPAALAEDYQSSAGPL